MINLERSGIPRDDQLPDLDPATLRMLSDRIVATSDSTGSMTVVDIRQRRPWLRRSALLAAAAVAAVAVTAVLLPSPPAEAWSATPTLAGVGTWSALEAECQHRMSTSAPAVVVERRGTSSLTVLADSSLCLDGTDLAGLGQSGALKSGGRDVVPAHEPTADQVRVVHAASLGGVGIAAAGSELPEGEMTAGYMGVTGRVGKDVEGIVIHARDRGDVTASIDHGWFAAWWPSLAEPTSLTVTTTTGTYDLAL